MCNPSARAWPLPSAWGSAEPTSSVSVTFITSRRAIRWTTAYPASTDAPRCAGQPLLRDHRGFEDNTTHITTAGYKHRSRPKPRFGRCCVTPITLSRPVGRGAPVAGQRHTAITDATAINRNRQARGGHEETWTSQTDFTTRFVTGGLRHEVLAGLELLREAAGRWSYGTGIATLAPTTVGNPVANPVCRPATAAKPFQRQYLYRVHHRRSRPGQHRIPAQLEGVAGNSIRQDGCRYSNGAQVDFGEWSFRTGLSWQKRPAALLSGP